MRHSLRASAGFSNVSGELHPAYAASEAALWRWLTLGMLLMTLTACVSPASAPSQTLWGPVIEFAQAEQGQPPSLIIQPPDVYAVWTGADHTGVHQDIRTWRGGQLGETVVLPLPPTHPFEQRLLPSVNRHLHLLWLDVGEDGQNRLFSALITPDLRVERGPIAVSNRPTLRYDAVSDGGGLWVVWSGGLAAEPTLYAQYVDRAGRPRPPQQIAANADWPALAHGSDGTIYLCWLRPPEMQIFSAVLRAGQAERAAPTGQRVSLAGGARLVSFRAGLDQTRLYLFWNIAAGTGQPESWISSSGLDSPWDTPPRQAIISIQSETRFETGFNSRAAAANASPAGSPVYLLSPLAGQFNVLIAAGQSAGQLVVVFFRNGEVVGAQTVTTAPELLASPALWTDQDRHLYLAWASLNNSGSANLNMTTTRR